MNNFLQGLMNYHFVQNALISSVLIGAVAGMIGCFIILRGMSLMGDAISHAVLPGVALSFILGINFFFGALAFGLLASFIIAFINRNSVVKSDTAIGITFSSFLGLNVSFYHYLLMFLLALVSITAMQSVGTVMIVALLITPAATAYLYSKSLKTMLALSAMFGSLSSIVGLVIGYTFNIAVGSTIVLTAAAFFVISFIVSPKQREGRKKA